MKNTISRKYRHVKTGPRQLGWWSWLKAMALLASFLLLLALMPTLVVLGIGKVYQNADRDPDRGAVAVQQTAFNDAHQVPSYLDQGWSQAQSLWYYNVTQGSNVIPYDFFLALEQLESNSESLRFFRDDAHLDQFRYLLQKETLFNPNGLPVGFVRDSYLGKDYLGFNCATCHTGQVNYRGKAVRIEGGPAMADLDGFLEALYHALQDTIENKEKQQRFVDKVLELNSWWRVFSGGRSYTSAEDVNADLKLWAERTRQYNQINESELDYGFARLDAFGRIYNRVLQHIVNRQQTAELLALAVDADGHRLVDDDAIETITAELNPTILGRDGFEKMVAMLKSEEQGLPGLSNPELQNVFEHFFNEANAPVSYPYLWGVAQTDYVQWNGLQPNAGVGALGRNTGQVIGVFASLEWAEDDSWYRKFSPAAMISGQQLKRHPIAFRSSVNGVNLSRMESQLKSLTSPVWDESVFGSIDRAKAARGRVHYIQYCSSCHELIDRTAWDRKITSKMLKLDRINTDPAMAMNATQYKGRSGNIGQTYQGSDVGQLIVGNIAPVRQILTSVTAGVIGTPDQDKWLPRRIADQVYLVAASFFNNDLKPSIKSGDYEPDTTADPYASLRAYKARPLNGIWATAPYLHNGSVPTLYDLMLPTFIDETRESKDACQDGKRRPTSFYVGSREFDPEKVGFVSNHDPNSQSQLFNTALAGNLNTGHEYAAGFTPQPGSDQALDMLCDPERMELLEFLKTL
ncbi:MAG: di-heme-cytochrome C peroxidase [Pseudomonadales bacterium]